MAENIKSKTSDLLISMAAACSLAAATCSTEEEIKKFKAYLEYDIAQVALRYPNKEGHIKRLEKVRDLALEFIKIVHESETTED